VGFGPYTLLTRLAIGGMGEVFLARRDDGRLLVLKRLLADLAGDPALVRMFYDEAALAGRLVHDNVARVEDFGEHDGRCFLAMEFFEGTTFTRLATRMTRPLDEAGVRIVVALVAQAARGLHHAHDATAPDGRPIGLIHRDVCHDNLFVTRGGVVKVLDFGIAKTLATPKTRTGILKGRFAYMTPEQLAGDLTIDRRADVFALGIVCWELLAGRSLFQREHDIATLHAVRHAVIDPPLEGLPPALNTAIGRALARDRDHRFATAADFADAIAGAVDPAAPAEIGALVERLFGAAVDELKARVAEGERTVTTTDVAIEANPNDAPTAIIVPPEAVWFDGGTPIHEMPFPPERPRATRPLAITAAAAVLAGALIAVVLATHGTGEPPAPASATAPVVVVVAAYDAALAARQPAPPAPPPPGAAPPAAPQSEPERASRRRAAASGRAPGRLSIDSFPYAVIWLDGRRLGQTPLLEIDVPAGTHVIKAVRADRKSQTFSITVKPGQTLPPRRLYW
jgi:eukaryotic-like serine/threonine-protein kinase